MGHFKKYLQMINKKSNHHMEANGVQCKKKGEKGTHTYNAAKP